MECGIAVLAISVLVNRDFIGYLRINYNSGIFNDVIVQFHWCKWRVKWSACGTNVICLSPVSKELSHVPGQEDPVHWIASAATSRAPNSILGSRRLSEIKGLVTDRIETTLTESFSMVFSRPISSNTHLRWLGPEFPHCQHTFGPGWPELLRQKTVSLPGKFCLCPHLFIDNSPSNSWLLGMI